MPQPTDPKPAKGSNWAWPAGMGGNAPAPDQRWGAQGNWALPNFQDQVVYFNPQTGDAIVTSDMGVAARLVAGGYQRKVVKGADWQNFTQAAAQSGVNITFADNKAADGSATTAPVGSGMTDQQWRDLMGGIGEINSGAAANQQNMATAYGIAQTARDRSVQVANENYGSQVQPTLTAASFSGAGYNQALGDLFGKRTDLNRTLAGLADQQTSAQFQYQVNQQAADQQRLQSVRQAYQDALSGVYKGFGSDLQSILQWLK